jgi:hypothetical protein
MFFFRLEIFKMCDLSEVGDRDKSTILPIFDLSEVSHNAPPTRLALGREGPGMSGFFYQ